jgi:hypothetical protein
MRLGILGWSTLSGVVLGLFVGLVATAVALGIAQVVPARWDWVVARLRVPVLVLCLVVLPVAGGVLGFLEGRLKLS